GARPGWELSGTPYTGSAPLPMAPTREKDCARRLVASAGVPVPQGVLIHPGEDVAAVLRQAELPLPLLVKPAWEGSSKGLQEGRSLADRREDVAGGGAWLHREYRQPALVEEYIEGEELTVGVLGNAPPEVLGTVRLRPKEARRRWVYDRQWKGRPDEVIAECPAYPAALARRIEQAARDAYRVLGCCDFARIDFRLRDGVPYFLEVNPLPDLNPDPDKSDLVFLARQRGLSYADFIEAVVQHALRRHSS